MDTISKKKRSQVMQAIRSKDTKIEVVLRKELQRRECRYRKHHNKLIGKPDIAFVKKKVAVFVDSCFWHGCPYHCRMPHSNRAYWNNKIKRNKERDKEVNKWYKSNGWIIWRFWEHSVQKNIQDCVKKIMDATNTKRYTRRCC
jgi:DNA mismatch endonuclease (patch repair protein)